MRKKKAILISAAIVAALLFNPLTLMVLWVGLGMWSNAHPETGVNVKTVDWLPPEATNISYYKTYSWRAYEFDMDEESFKRWARRWDLKPIKEEETITRYSYTSFLKQSRNYRNAKVYEAEEKKHVATVSTGLYDREIRRNGGGYHVVYDREKQRAYFQSNPR